MRAVVDSFPNEVFGYRSAPTALPVTAPRVVPAYSGLPREPVPTFTGTRRAVASHSYLAATHHPDLRP